MRELIALSAMLMLAGCAAIEVKVPVNGKVGGQTAFGYAIGRGDGSGVFVGDTASGVHCEGKYDSSITAETLTVNAVCNDGRTVQLLVQRKPDKANGIATGTLSDGTKAQFVYGKNIRYEDEFPGPDATAPVAKASTVNRNRR